MGQQEKIDTHVRTDWLAFGLSTVYVGGCIMPILVVHQLVMNVGARVIMPQIPTSFHNMMLTGSALSLFILVDILWYEVTNHVYAVFSGQNMAGFRTLAGIAALSLAAAWLGRYIVLNGYLQ